MVFGKQLRCTWAQTRAAQVKKLRIKWCIRVYFDIRDLIDFPGLNYAEQSISRSARVVESMMIIFDIYRSRAEVRISYQVRNANDCRITCYQYNVVHPTGQC